MKHFLYCPLLGLGLYGGSRGNRWLRNRIKIFKQFVIPSLIGQTNQNFTLWISARPEDRNNSELKELAEWLEENAPFKSVFTFGGLCFFDDKYPTEEATKRLAMALHYSLENLIDLIGEDETVLMTIQPSDDLYAKRAIETVQATFIKYPELECVGFPNGYIVDYTTKQVAEYNPTTNPPFYTIKFKKSDFIDPTKHMVYTSLKQDVGKYPKGTPIPSHEYPPYALKYGIINERGFCVGTHGENISTFFNNPFKGAEVPMDVLTNFSIYEIPAIKISRGWRRKLFQKLPYQVQRKLRYWIGERFSAKLYNLIFA